MPQVKNMNKYVAVLNSAWQRQFTFRANILAFRVGNLIELSFQLFIWLAVYSSTALVGGYSQKEMMTYLVLSWLFTFFTTTYGIEEHVGSHIRDGKLSEFLIKPMSYLRYMVALSIGRSSMASIFGVLIVVFFMAIFHGSLIFPTDIRVYFLVLTIVIIGVFVRLFLAILVGMIAFWSTEMSGINYTINTVIRFLTGGFAPLNLLPKALFQVTLWTPFIYINFFPAQLYLGKTDIRTGVIGIGVELIWLCILYFLIKLVWSFGVRRYEAFGN